MASLIDIIRRITIKATTDGVDATTAKLRQLAGAQGGVAVASDKTTRATLSTASALEKNMRTLDANYRGQQQLLRVGRELDAARAQGLISQSRHNELLGLAQAKYSGAAVGARAYASALATIRTVAAGLGLGIGVGLLTQIPRMIGGIVDEAGNLVDTADKIGLTTKALQELKFAGGQTGVEFAEMSGALSFFNKNIGAASRGSGDLYEILKLNNVSLRDQSGRLRPVMDLMGDYADLVKNAASDQERATLITKAFGKSNDELINTFAGGRDGLRDFADEATRAGQIIEDGLLRENERIGDEWAKFTGRLSASFQSFVLHVARGVALTIDDLSRLERFLRPVVSGGFSGPAEITVNSWKGRAAAPPVTKPTILPSEDLNNAANEMERLRKQFDDALKSTVKQTAALEAQAGALGMTAGASATFQKQQELTNLAVTNHIALTPQVVAGIEATAAAYGAATEQLARLKLIEDLRFARAQMFRSPIDQTIASTLQSAGLPIDFNSFEAGMIRTNELLKLGRDLSADFLKGFASDLRSGVSLVDALGNAFDRLSDKLIDMALDQAINTFFGTLLEALGGGLASGGGLSSLGGGHGGRSAMSVANDNARLSLPAARQATASGPIAVHVHNAPAGTSVKSATTSRDSDGGLRLDVMLDNAVADNLSRPGTRSNRAGRSMGLSAGVVRRGA